MRQQSIIIIDDEEPILRTFNRLLSCPNLNVYTCVNAKQALELFNLYNINIVICDQFIPGMVGIQFLRLIGRISPNTIRILMSGFVERSLSMNIIKREGIFAVINKPFSNQKVSELIENALQCGRSMKQANENIGKASGLEMIC